MAPQQFERHARFWGTVLSVLAVVVLSAIVYYAYRAWTGATPGRPVQVTGSDVQAAGEVKRESPASQAASPSVPRAAPRMTKPRYVVRTNIPTAAVPWGDSAGDRRPVTIPTAALPWRADSQLRDPVNIPLATLRKWAAPPHFRGTGAPPELAAAPAPRDGDQTLPPDPLTALRADPACTPELLAFLERWQAAIACDAPLSSEQLRQVGPLLKNTTLAPKTLIDVARGLAFVQGARAALPWFAAGAARIEATLADRVPPSSNLNEALAVALARDSVRQVYDMSKAEREDSRQALEVCHVFYRILAQWEPRGSYPQWRARLCQGEMAYVLTARRDAYSAEAMAIFKDMLAGNMAWKMSERDIGELNYALGCINFQCGYYDDAIPYFTAATKVDSYYTRPAKILHFEAMALAGHKAEATTEFKALQANTKMHESNIRIMQGMIDTAPAATRPAPE